MLARLGVEKLDYASKIDVLLDVAEVSLHL